MSSILLHAQEEGARPIVEGRDAEPDLNLQRAGEAHTAVGIADRKRKRQAILGAQEVILCQEETEQDPMKLVQ